MSWSRPTLAVPASQVQPATAWCSECNAPTDYPGAPCAADHEDEDEDEDEDA